MLDAAAVNEGASQAQGSAHDENGALVEAFKMGLNMASQSKAAPKQVQEPPQMKYPTVTDGGGFAPPKGQRCDIPSIF